MVQKKDCIETPFKEMAEVKVRGAGRRQKFPVKRRITFGFLSIAHFAIGTAKVDSSQIIFAELLFGTLY